MVRFRELQSNPVLVISVHFQHDKLWRSTLIRWPSSAQVVDIQEKKTYVVLYHIIRYGNTSSGHYFREMHLFLETMWIRTPLTCESSIYLFLIACLQDYLFF